MSEEDDLQKKPLEENKELNSLEQKNTSLNNQIQPQENNITPNSPIKNEQLKFGQYYLTPLQSILLNKKFPFGFKLETEENILKSLEITRAQEKKNKQAQKNNQSMGRRSSNKLLQQPKRNKNTYKPNIPNNIPPEKYKIYKQCIGGFERIKESKYFDRYYISPEPTIPSLSFVEKKLNNYEYSSLFEFEMDVRNIWNYYFNLNPNDEVVKKMSEDWEKICSDLDNNTNSEKGFNDTINKAEALKKELESYKEHRGGNVPAPTKRPSQNNDSNKPMTVDEKNQLGNLIRSLNKEQLKGIIRILNDSDSVPKSKYFEFDIDKLPNKKLRDLEKYVKDCISANNRNSKNLHNNINRNQIQKDNINKTNSNTTNTKNNINQQQNVNQLSNQKNKEVNKTQENKQDNPSAKKNRQSTEKKIEKNNKDDSSSESLSSDSSLSG